MSFLRIPNGIPFEDIERVMRRAWRLEEDVRGALRENFPSLSTQQIDMLMAYGSGERWFK